MRVVHAAIRQTGAAATFDDDSFDVTIHGRRATVANFPLMAEVGSAEIADRTAVLFSSPKRRLGVVYRVGDKVKRHTVRTATDMTRRLAEFLVQVTDGPSAEPWERSSEELIRRLYLLLDQKDALIDAMARAYERDRETAEARISLLEAQLAALEAERVRTNPRWRDPKTIGTIAMIVATILGPIAAVVVDQRLDKPVGDVVSQAHKVQADCNVTINTALPPTG